MEASRAFHQQPLRIDVATSHIEGGQALGWVDPDRVTGCVAFSEPRDAFERFALSHLQDASPDDVPSGSLPSGVAALVAGLKAAHLRLYRENHSLMKEPKWVWVTAACAEEGRIYFVRTQSSWIYLLRAGRAFLIGGDGDRRSAIVREEALGGHEKLRLQVTSLDVTRDDTVLLVAGDADEPPDLRAVSRLYAESRDLKRACDGLVNLLGLQGPSAGVVAFRFTPLLSGAHPEPLDTAKGEEILGQIAEMAREVVLAAREGPLEPPAAEPAPPAPVIPAAAATPPPLAPEAPRGPRRLDPPQAAEPTPRPPAPELEAAALRHRTVQAAAARARRARRTAVVPFVVLIVLLGLLAIVLLGGAAWPDLLERARGIFERVRGGGAPTQTYGLVDFISDPPGATVMVDGERLAGATPLVQVRLPRGRHTVTMRLGVAGAAAESFEVDHERHTKLHASFIGALEVRARDGRGHPQAWLAGQSSRQALPARFDGLAAGWHRVFFEDERFALWERKVLVRGGEVTGLEINNAFDARNVLVQVESLHMSSARGLEPVAGADSVFVDRGFIGLAPVELEVAPGLHGVRVAAAGESYCEILDLPAGSSHFITPQFGLQARPSFQHRPPALAGRNEPLVLAVTIRGAGGDVRQPQVLVPRGFDHPLRLPLIKDPSVEDLYTATLAPGQQASGPAIAYYFSVLTPEGEEAVSELFGLATGRSLAARPQAPIGGLAAAVLP